MGQAQEIAKLLLDVKTVKVSMNPPFLWTSGIRSPVYCDNRRLISYPTQRKKIVEGFVDIIHALLYEPDCIGGTATAAIPWAAFVAYELDLPMVYIRPEKKAHGAGKQVEGDLPAGKRVLIVEDLVSTGGSSINSAQAVQRECKGVVSDVISIVTWELPEAHDHFREAGLRLRTLTDFSHLISCALQTHLITKNEWEKILEFKKDPRAWGKNL